MKEKKLGEKRVLATTLKIMYRYREHLPSEHYDLLDETIETLEGLSSTAKPYPTIEKPIRIIISL